MKTLLPKGLIVLAFFFCSSWGFYGHKRINYLSVFTLPPEMIGFYKYNIDFITEASVNPDRRRFSVVDEAPRHYIDLDHYGDSALQRMPRYWNQAVGKYSEDTLKAYGIVPWHVNRMYYQLKEAFMLQDPERILKTSAELGHYIGDAHVPLHTTENYNGQLTGQEGIHGFWESRLVELYSSDYDFFVGRAEYISNPQLRIWEIVSQSHLLKDTVLLEEKKLAVKFGEKRFSFETKGRQTVKVFSEAYAKAYHKILKGMVERRMRSAVFTVGSFWYTAWVDAGQPDLKKLIGHKPSEEDLIARRAELEAWKKKTIRSREHEGEGE
jgi:hypothetical protein